MLGTSKTHVPLVRRNGYPFIGILGDIYFSFSMPLYTSRDPTQFEESYKLPTRSSIDVPKLSSSRKLVINLSLNKKGAPDVRSVELLSNEYRNRTSFGHRAALTFIFSEPMLIAIERCLNDVSLDEGVLSLPEFSLEEPGLFLKGAHVLVSKVDACKSHVILRFNLFLGDLSTLFKENFGFGDGVLREADKLAVLTISDLVRPLLDVCVAIRFGLVEASNPNLTSNFAIENLALELGFHSELLKRHIDRYE